MEPTAKPLDAFKARQSRADAIADRLLAIAAGNVSKPVAEFLGWAIAAFGAAIGLMVASVVKTSELVVVSELKLAAYLYMLAFVLHIFQRFLAVSSAVLSQSVADAVKAIQEEDLASPELEAEASDDLPRRLVEHIFVRLERTTMWPFKRRVAKHLETLRKSGKTEIFNTGWRRAHVEVYLAVAQLLLLVVVGLQIIRAIK